MPTWLGDCATAGTAPTEMTEGLMSMLLIEVVEEVRRNFVIVMVHVEMARNVVGSGSNAWKRWGRRTKTFLLVVLACNGEWILGGGPA